MNAGQNYIKLESVPLKFTTWANVTQVTRKYKLGPETSLLQWRRSNPLTFASLYQKNVFKTIMAHTSEKLDEKREGNTKLLSLICHARLTSRLCSVVSESVIFNTLSVADVWVFALIIENFQYNLEKKRKTVRLVLEIGPKLINLSRMWERMSSRRPITGKCSHGK